MSTKARPWASKVKPLLRQAHKSANKGRKYCVYTMDSVGGAHVKADLSHLTYTDYEHVYEPAEDTFLLMDALIKDKIFLRILKPVYCVEVGCGTGSVSAVLQKLLCSIGSPTPYFLLTDINPQAAKVAYTTCLQNNMPFFDVVRTNLFCGLEESLEDSVDVLIFNPPYVPTPAEEVGSTGISAAWAGGVDGRVVIDRFLSSVDRLLSRRGVLYLLLVEENKPEEIAALMASRGFSTKIVLRKQAKNESQLVMKLFRNRKLLE